MVRIKEYDLNVTIGQAIGKMLDNDIDGYLSGKYDEKIIKIVKKSLLLKNLVTTEVANDPILSGMLDATLKY